MEGLKRRALLREQLEKDASNETEEEEDETIMDEESIGADEEGEELWNEDDVLVQVHVGSNGYDKRLKILRRPFSEVTIAFAVHLVFLLYCMAVNITDATVFKQCTDHDQSFPGYNTFGGRFKYLTHVFMWGLLVYFFLAFFADVMPHSAAKVWFHRLVDWLFSTAVWPAAWMVVLLFWGLVSVDLKLVGRTKEFDNNIPYLLDHAWHTFPVFIVTIETLLVYHRYPSNLAAAFSVFGTVNSYIVWMVIVFTMTRIWPYPFLNYLNPFTFILFAAACFLLGGTLFVFGKMIAYYRWKERFQVLYELSNEMDQIIDEDDHD